MLLPVSIFLVLAMALSVPGGRSIARAGWRFLACVGARPYFAALLVFVLTGVLYAIPWMFGYVSPPVVHDEISNLLAADTFRHWRLTNPSPPYWQAFETLHTIVTPTYASKFPPGLGLIYALGWLLGSPRVGAILAGALAGAATAWMLRSRMSWRLAMVGALIASLIPIIYGWTQGFWGGNLPMCGASLFIGATLRCRRTRSLRVLFKLGTIAGVGLAVLANTRPFEGVLLAILMFAWQLVAPMIRDRRNTTRFAAGAALVLVPVFAWMGYYNYRVTGNALQMPYALHAKQYMIAPIMWWNGVNQPTRTENQYITTFHADTEFREYDGQRTRPGFLHLNLQRFGLVLSEAMYPLVGIVAITGGAMALWSSRLAKYCLLISLAFLILHMVTTPWLRPHYLAPIAPLWALFGTMSLHHLKRIPFLRRGAIAIALIGASATYALTTTIRAAKDALAVPDGRTAVLRAIEQVPGKHIVFVAYLPDALTKMQFVYNPADIDSAPVLFVHGRDPDTNTALVNHFADRSIWTLTVSADDASLNRIQRPGAK